MKKDTLDLAQKKSIEYFDKGIEVEANGTTSGAPNESFSPLFSIIWIKMSLH